MILCLFHNEWALAGRRRTDIPGCSLSVRNAIGHLFESYGFEPNRSGTFWHRYVPSIASLDIVFFPEVYHHGLRVYPMGWLADTEEPVIKCEAMPLSLEDFSDEHFQRIFREKNTTSASEVLIADG